MKSPSSPISPSNGNGIVIIDNYDSNTYNIRETLGKIGYQSEVYRNDEIDLSDLRAMNPSHVILGPGPGTPDNPDDVGVCPDVIYYATKSHRALFGICLGQQIMVKEAGGTIVRASKVMHGKTSALLIRDHPDLAYRGLFADLPEKERIISVMRYHSLVCKLPESTASDLFPTAVSLDCNDYLSGSVEEVTMAVQNATLPHYGVQFHPESLFTDHGATMLKTFAEIAKGAKPVKKNSTVRVEGDVPQKMPYLPDRLHYFVSREHLNSFLYTCEFPCDLPPEEVHERLHATGEDCFCFESLSPAQGEGEKGSGRYSYFGFKPSFVLKARNAEFFLDDDKIDLHGRSPLSMLEDVYGALRSEVGDTTFERSKRREGQLFTGGLVGYMSYEALQYTEKKFPGTTPPGQGTFAFGFFPDGLLYDRKEKKYTYFLRGDGYMPGMSGRRGVDLYTSVLERNPCKKEPSDSTYVSPLGSSMEDAVFEQKVASIIEDEIRAGNAQQVVLSRRKSYEISGSSIPIYKRYRKLFPSANMHAIRIGGAESMGSMPELMMRVQDGEIMTTQLAGTRKRGKDAEEDAAIFEDLRSDEKEQAEHRMLIDQARNDIGRSSELGTVRVEEQEMMYRKDAGPVMHIATTIRGKLAPGLSPMQAHAYIAPMGTVSGAPKVRASQIIGEQEEGMARGLYAGSIGFFDMSGNAEFVIGLRNIVCRGNILTVQAGAGIVHDSIPAKEFEETQHKMRAPEKVLEPFLSRP